MTCSSISFVWSYKQFCLLYFKCWVYSWEFTQGDSARWRLIIHVLDNHALDREFYHAFIHGFLEFGAISCWLLLLFEFKSMLYSCRKIDEEFFKELKLLVVLLSNVSQSEPCLAHLAQGLQGVAWLGTSNEWLENVQTSLYNADSILW